MDPGRNNRCQIINKTLKFNQVNFILNVIANKIGTRLQHDTNMKANIMS